MADPKHTRRLPVPKDIKAGLALMDELTKLRVEKRVLKQTIAELERKVVAAERRAGKALPPATRVRSRG